MLKWYRLKRNPSEAGLCKQTTREMLRVTNYLHWYWADTNLAHAVNLMKTLIRLEVSHMGLLWLWQFIFEKNVVSLNNFNHYNSILPIIHKQTVKLLYFVTNQDYKFLIKHTSNKSNHGLFPPQFTVENKQAWSATEQNGASGDSLLFSTTKQSPSVP